MKVAAWAIGGRECVRPLSAPEEALGSTGPDAAAQPSGPAPFKWIEIEDAQADELARAIDALDLHPIQRNEILDEARTNRILALGSTLVLEFPCAVEIDRDPHPYVSFVAREGTLVTVLRGRRADRTKIVERLRHALDPAAVDLQTVTAHLLGDLVAESMAVAADVREETEELTTRVHREPLRVRLGTIRALTRRVQHAALVAEDQRFTLDSLVAGLAEESRYAVLARELEHLQRQLDHVLTLGTRLTEHLRSIHAHATGARDAIDSSRLRLLTVISAIFLPLNLIAGIYGMNFVRDASHPWNMPELDWRFGYFFALGLMGAVATALLVVFWGRGWMRGGIPRSAETRRSEDDDEE